MKYFLIKFEYLDSSICENFGPWITETVLVELSNITSNASFELACETIKNDWHYPKARYFKDITVR